MNGSPPFRRSTRLPLLRQRDHHGVEFGLRHRMAVALFAYVDALRLFSDQFHYGGRDQPVVQHDVRLLHQAQGAERQQVRVARSSADQVDFPGLEISGRGIVEFVLQGLDGRGFPSREQHLDDRSLEDVLPEPAALAEIREALLDPGRGTPAPRSPTARRSPAPGSRVLPAAAGPEPARRRPWTRRSARGHGRLPTA